MRNAVRTTIVFTVAHAPQHQTHRHCSRGVAQLQTAAG